MDEVSWEIELAEAGWDGSYCEQFCCEEFDCGDSDCLEECNSFFS